ncbi:hypothetical protein K438DRAFT_1201847 [Mycena galopus ATCC 62051]|nr:hypothetical protein K438DRAFT_1201847 [Mycena galopus ATCC 62051]
MKEREFLHAVLDARGTSGEGLRFAKMTEPYTPGTMVIFSHEYHDGPLPAPKTPEHSTHWRTSERQAVPTVDGEGNLWSCVYNLNKKKVVVNKLPVGARSSTNTGKGKGRVVVKDVIEEDDREPDSEGEPLSKKPRCTPAASTSGTCNKEPAKKTRRAAAASTTRTRSTSAKAKGKGKGKGVAVEEESEWPELEEEQEPLLLKQRHAPAASTSRTRSTASTAADAAAPDAQAAQVGSGNASTSRTRSTSSTAADATAPDAQAAQVGSRNASTRTRSTTSKAADAATADAQAAQVGGEIKRKRAPSKSKGVHFASSDAEDNDDVDAYYAPDTDEDDIRRKGPPQPTLEYHQTLYDVATREPVARTFKYPAGGSFFAVPMDAPAVKTRSGKTCSGSKTATAKADVRPKPHPLKGALKPAKTPATTASTASDATDASTAGSSTLPDTVQCPPTVTQAPPVAPPVSVSAPIPAASMPGPTAGALDPTVVGNLTALLGQLSPHDMMTVLSAQSAQPQPQ